MVRQQTPRLNFVAGPGIGLVLGVAIGAAMGNVGLGIALGLVFGAALGVATSGQGNADSPEKK